jgi:hypothetical protein
MSWSKLISAILHPIVMPTIGLFLYFIYTPYSLSFSEQLFFLSLIFSATYIVPILMLMIMRVTNNISSVELPSIKERKVPLFIMMCLFLILGKYFSFQGNISDLSILFYGTLMGLMVMYLLFFKGIKTSIHLLSMGSAVGFFIVFQQLYQISVIPIITILILFSGILATARLNLKAHTPKEVYLGFLLGVSCQIITYYFL